jgi:hypothetical protein
MRERAPRLYRKAIKGLSIKYLLIFCTVEHLREEWPSLKSQQQQHATQQTVIDYKIAQNYPCLKY